MALSRGKGERGQILVFVAAAFLVMLGVTAIGVDLGYGMLGQRNLQNTSDAAALAAATEILASGDANAAYNVARDLVMDSTNNEVDPPNTTSVPQGTSLTWGIEIGSDGVRVALRRPLTTFFARAIGIDTITVGARSHTGTSPMGVLPIAVKRYSDGDTRTQLGDGPNEDVSSVIDYVAAESQPQITEWPDPPWPNLLIQQAVGPASTASPGAELAILGNNADPNVPATGNAFNFWVGPHVRNLTSSPPMYLDPVTPSMTVQQWNNIEADLFLDRDGFMGNYPYVGQEIAAINGIDAQKTVGRMEDLYNPGDTVIAMVYDGTVHRKPNFELKMINPSDGKWSGSIPTLGFDTETPSGTPVQYQFRLTPVDDFSGSVTLTAEGLEDWETGDVKVHWRICDGGSCGSVDGAKDVVISMSAKDLTLEVWGQRSHRLHPPLDHISDEASTINIVGQSLGFSRYQLLVAGIQVGSSSFFITPKNGKVYDSVVPGQGSATFTLNLSGSNFADPSDPEWTALPGDVSWRHAAGINYNASSPATR